MLLLFFFFFFLFIPQPSFCFHSKFSSSACVAKNNSVVLSGLSAGKTGCSTNFLTKAFAFCPPWRLGPSLGLEQSMCGRTREGETTYGCNLKILFLVTLKCGKSKWLSMGRLWEGKLGSFGRGVRGSGGFDLLAEFSHFQLRGRFAAIGLLNVTIAYLH